MGERTGASGGRGEDWTGLRGPRADTGAAVVAASGSAERGVVMVMVATLSGAGNRSVAADDDDGGGDWLVVVVVVVDGGSGRESEWSNVDVLTTDRSCRKSGSCAGGDASNASSVAAAPSLSRFVRTDDW